MALVSPVGQTEVITIAEPAPPAAGITGQSLGILLPVTISLGAFLLFLLEPLFAKLILPRFGGSAAVWAMCLVFFQCALLLGYVYADVITRRLTLTRQLILHVSLLAAQSLFAAHCAARDLSFHSQAIIRPHTYLMVLTVSIGLPFILLSATSPLVQAWYTRTQASSGPYHLFALSNFASLLALLSFPFLIEPRLSSHQQSLLWSALFIVFVATCSITGWFATRTTGHARPNSPSPVAEANRTTRIARKTPVAESFCLRLDALALHHQSHHGERGAGAAVVGAAARVVFAHVYDEFLSPQPVFPVADGAIAGGLARQPELCHLRPFFYGINSGERAAVLRRSLRFAVCSATGNSLKGGQVQTA